VLPRLALALTVAVLWNVPVMAQAQIEILPGEDLAEAARHHPEGTEFLIRAGVHRGQSVEPRNGQTFTGEAGAVLTGAVLLDAWYPEGEYWVIEDQTWQGQVHGHCTPDLPGYEGCRYPEDLFFDDEPLWQETSLSELDAPGEWFFDYVADRIYVLDDPTAVRVELSVTRHAFHGSAEGVTIQDLVIEKYAPPAQHAAVHAWSGTSGPQGRDWIVRNNEIRWNHALGVRTSHGMIVSGNQIIENGQLGIGGSGNDVLVENNTISRNHWAGFNPFWEAGGTKWVLTDGLVVRGNTVRDNDGPGLWTDIDNVNVLYEGNWVTGNAQSGIFHEISRDAVIRYNVSKWNGAGFDPWLWGAQILVSTSRNVEIHDNTVVVGAGGGNGITLVQQNRGDGLSGPHVTTGNRVHHNHVTFEADRGLTGAAADHDPQTMFNGGNHFYANRYVVPDLGGRRWAWWGLQDWTGWRNAGHGQDASVEMPPPAASCGLLGIEPLLLLWLVSRPRRCATSPAKRLAHASGGAR